MCNHSVMMKATRIADKVLWTAGVVIMKTLAALKALRALNVMRS